MVEYGWMGGHGKELGEIGESGSIESEVPTEFHLRLYMLRDETKSTAPTRFGKEATGTMTGL